MGSKRRLRRKECEGKIRYEKVEHAHAEVLIARNKRGWHNVHAYKCPHCSGWHVGRTSGWQSAVLKKPEVE